MNGKDHFAAGFVAFMLVHLLLSVFHLGDDFPNPTYAAFTGAVLIGAFLPDIDKMPGSMKYHRNTITHSSIIPLLLSVSYGFTAAYPGLVYQLVFVCIGNATHLLLDIIPNTVPAEMREAKADIIDRWAWRIREIRAGRVGGVIKGPPFGISSQNEQKWLLGHALVCFLLAFLLYLKLLFGVDLDLPTIDW